MAEGGTYAPAPNYNYPALFNVNAGDYVIPPNPGISGVGCPGNILMQK
jgi:hypothetical protein